MGTLVASSLTPALGPAGATTSLLISPTPGPGSYTVTVTGSDGSSCTRSDSATLTVLNVTISSEMRDTSCQSILNGSDVVFSGSVLKLAATNPGGYMYNASVTNITGSTTGIAFSLTFPANQGTDPLPSGAKAFAVWGSMPVHVFTGNPCAPGGATDITPPGITFVTTTGILTQPLSTNSTLLTGAITIPTINVPNGGTVWVQVHNRYGLIGTSPWQSNSPTAFVRGYTYQASITVGGSPLTDPMRTNLTETGKKVTAIGGYAIDTNGIGKGGLGISLNGCSSNVTATSTVQDMTGFYFWTVPAGTSGIVSLCNSFATPLAQTNISPALAADEFRQIDFLGLSPADPVIEGIVGTSSIGIGNATVELIGPGRRVLSTTITNSGGRYIFRFTAPGEYTVKVTSPSGGSASRTLFVKMFETVRVDFLLSN